MLEEALRDEKGRNPSETALAVLNFLQYDLAPGGSAAEARLCNSLFGPLCDRVFGPMDEPSYAHAAGAGWLSAQARWARPAAPTTASSSSSFSSSASSSMHQPPPSVGLSSNSSHGTGMSRSTVHSSSVGGVGSSSGSHWEADPVVRLLATANNRALGGSSTLGSPSSSSSSSLRKEPVLPTLIEAISGDSENRPNAGFAFPFLALPKVLQDAYMEVLEADLAGMSGMGMGMQSEFGGNARGQSFAGRNSPQAPSAALVTDNDLCLFGRVLQRPPREQMGLLRWRHVRAQRDKAAAAAQHAHSPQQQFRTSSPMNVYQGGGFPSRSFRNASATPAASLLSPGGLFAGGAGGSGAAHPAREEPKAPPVTVILTMLEYYLLLFVRFPTAISTAANTANAARATASATSVQPIYTPFGEMVYVYLFARYLGYFLPYAMESGRCVVMGGSDYNVQSELFLRLCVSLWLEAPVRPVPTTAAVALLADQQHQQYLRRGAADHTRHQDGATSSDEARTFDYSLDRSFDLVQTHQPFSPPSSHVKACLRKLIVHALSDPSLRNGMVQHASSSSSSPAAGGSNGAAGATFVRHSIWVLQAPLYNYVRVAFRNASIHTNNSAFFSALDIWLLYLEPWNLTRRTFPSSSRSIWLPVHVLTPYPPPDLRRQPNRSTL
jgi:hypothetical protein